MKIMNLFKKEQLSHFAVFLRPIYNKWFKAKYSSMSTESVFTEIYRKNLWGGTSRSGTGSDLVQTETIRMKLPSLFKELQISTLLDIPCGDFYWLKKINLDFLSYTGADIVDDIINHNNKNYAKKNRTFVKLNILMNSLPKVDLIFCRDMLTHFSFKDIFTAIDNIKASDSKYLLTTTHISTKENKDIVTGEWRALNLLLPPFSFPKPLLTIDEKCTIKNCHDKNLFLWNIKDL